MSQPILLDESLFDEAFIPERLVCRDGQIKEIARCLGPIRNGKSGRNLFIYGPPGTGKTSVCKWILKEHFPKQSVYVNCWSKKSTNSVLQEILFQLGHVIHGRESTDDLVRKIERLNKKIIVCLDESDHIKDLDVLYIIARNSHNMILVSNQSYPIPKMDSRIRSSVLLNEIEFKHYSSDEILQILKERVAYGIRQTSLEIQLLSILSKICCGDARVALQGLKIAAKEAEAKDLDKITIDEIRSAIKCSRKYRRSYVLGKLNDHQMIIYRILKDNGSMRSGELFKEYLRVSREPVVDRAYRNYMERLVELGLVKRHGDGKWRCYESIT